MIDEKLNSLSLFFTRKYFNTVTGLGAYYEGNGICHIERRLGVPEGVTGRQNECGVEAPTEKRGVEEGPGNQEP